jgi:hypothetical protein
MDFDAEGRLIIPKNKEKKLTKEELIFWKEKYDKENNSLNQTEEEQLRKSFQEKGFMSKEDFIRILKWKFQGRLVGRQKRMLNLIKDYDSRQIEQLSKKAFNSNQDEIRIDLLSQIPSIKNSLSSVILTFYNPQGYGILDIHSWRELFGKEPKDIFSNKKKVIIFFNKLREIAKETNLSCREIEKALFKKNIDKDKK